MSYENIKKELETIVRKHYESGETYLTDIRAALHAVGLTTENWAARELMEDAREMAIKFREGADK